MFQKNADGIPIDAWESNENGIPDYLQPNPLNENDYLVIYNALSLDDSNAVNYIFTIKNIENYPHNIVAVYDTWGNKVYKTHTYITKTKIFLKEKLQIIHDIKMESK